MRPPVLPRRTPTPRLSKTSYRLFTTSAPPPPISRARLIAAGLAVAGGATLLASRTSQPLQAQSPPSPALDLDDPLSRLSPQLLATATSHLTALSLSDLVRQYVVYFGSSQGYLVEAGPWILDKLQWAKENVPLLGSAVWGTFAVVMKGTFYSVFVGAGTVPECAGLVDNLEKLGIGCMLNYSAEAAEEGDGQGVHVANLDEALSAVKAAALFESPSSSSALVPRKQQDEYSIKPTMFAIKMSGLVHDHDILARATAALQASTSFQRGGQLPSGVLFPESPDLSEEDHETLNKLYAGLRKVGEAAKDGGVRLMVDAEYSNYQPAINRYADLLAQEFNKVTPTNSANGPAIPIIYNTYQAYLRTTPGVMAAAMAHADANGYAFGAKLVRGAYVECERSRHAASGAPGDCVVWNSKPETDNCYDECALLLEKRIASDIGKMKPGTAGTGVVYASHNGMSMQKVLVALREQGLAKNVDGGLQVDERVRGRISFSQLLGMSDNLTSALVSVLGPTNARGGIPYVVKYVPYASLDQAMPYLIRRANENQAILQPDPISGRGGAKGERRAVGKEIRSRLGLAF
ncbi:proline dehydrogenase [Pseudohyphozyma bogoriensis]|nr:proline dehydrogenase [Pseudohyphozyma bogoriensis]